MKTKLIICILYSINFAIFSQNLTQSIYGQILDKLSNEPIVAAVVSLDSINLQTESDSAGNFTITNIPIGNYNVSIQAFGYESHTEYNIQLTSSRNYLLNIFLQQNISTLNEVILHSKSDNRTAINPTITLSNKVLNVEEAGRYAGSLDDPARLVASFAGVSSNIGNNGISVRGNNPKALQWRLEGIEIPNPNHFADNAVFGAGVLSALSKHNLGNSDFLSGAFPAEYNNALSGIFDMNIKNGNNLNKEKTIQIGLTGIDYAEEGPFKKGKKSSYIFNYRYSTLSLIKPLLPQDGGKGVKYQDFSFKMNFPTKKIGNFTLWGIGLKDVTGIYAKKDSSKWETITDKQTQDINYFMASGGITHKLFLTPKTFLKSTLAATSHGMKFNSDEIQQDYSFNPDKKINSKYTNFIFNSTLNSKITPKHTSKTGISYTNMRYDLLLKNLNTTLINTNGYTGLLNIFHNSTFILSNALTVNLGLNYQKFLLNNHQALEPRVGIKYCFTSNQNISLGYGLHSRLEKLHYYFAQNTAFKNPQINKNLDFTKSHHFILGYDFQPSSYTNLKIETYFQYLYNVPVINDSTYSFINLTNDWFVNTPLQNTGLGKNIGIDISWDKYIKNGFYYNANLSIFNSQYQAGDKIWRNTRFNRNFHTNFLIGKEWQLGKKHSKSFGANIRLSYQGGDRYSPVNSNLSSQQQSVVFNETYAFSKQLKPSFVTHFSLIYKINKKKTSRELALKILNAGAYREFYDFQYNFKTHEVQEHREVIIIPNISYKIEF